MYTLTEVNVYTLYLALISEVKHVDAFRLALDLTRDELEDVAVACDIPTSGNREQLALAVTVGARGMDEDEITALRREVRRRIAELRAAASRWN